VRQIYPVVSDTVDLDALYSHGDGVVRANFVASLDGSATVTGRSGGLSSPADESLFNRLRSHCDVILVGAATVRAEDYGPSKHAPIAVVTGSLDLDPTSRFFEAPTHRPIIVTTADADPIRRKALEEVADVVVAGEHRAEMPRVLDALADRGLRRVLTEGGPTLFAELSAAGRLDELALTVAPRIVGGMGKRISDGAMSDPPLAMRLGHVLEDDEFLFTLYRRN
jgi:riboflavin-specific deaminase-like protein